MKQISFLVMALFCAISVLAQEESPDTISAKELGEIVVVAQNQRTNSTSSTYIPMKRQKDSATDAISLLSQMAIPQLEVQPGNFNVKKHIRPKRSNLHQLRFGFRTGSYRLASN